MSLSVFIAVTHLLGAGHLTRAAAIGRALVRAGHRVTLVSGGMPAKLIAADGLDLVQLPAVRATDEDFRTLSDEAGHQVAGDYMDVRRDILLATFRDVRPDVLITELYPFGRRVLAAEFRALLEAAEAARPKPLVLCSVRDILVAPVKPGRVEEAHRLIARHYDAVLVHGDPDLVPLDASWPLDSATASRLVYTGYVDAAPVAAAGPQPGPDAPILVSGGSSVAALPLYRAALGAAALLPERRWHLLVGGSVGEAAFSALRDAAPQNVGIERARPDFRALLRGAGIFVGLAGYNTVLDLLDARARAVLVPFERGRETEQRLRAERLAARKLALLLPEAELSPETLAERVREALAMPRPPAAALDRDGAEATARIVEELVAERGRSFPTPAVRAPAMPAATRSLITDSLERRADQGRLLQVWWRDDDAVAHTPALDRLLSLAGHAGIPLAIAAVPALVEPSLVQRLSGEERAAVLVHGLAHTDHAPGGAKKAEFGAHRPLAALEREAARGRRLLCDAFGRQALDVFVPPWNRIAHELAATLPRLGFGGLSTFGPRSAVLPDGLAVVNTHIDPVDWRGSGGLIEAEAFGRMWRRAIERDEPVGLLTHHLSAAEAVWGFCEAFVEIMAGHPAVSFPALAKLLLAASTHHPDGDPRGGAQWANA